MDSKPLTDLAARIERNAAYDADLCEVAFQAVGAHLPHLDETMIRDGALGGTDAAIMVIDHGLPGWTISVNGVASKADGHWVVKLRRSGDCSDELMFGTGKGPKLSNVLIGALLRALSRRCQRDAALSL